MLVLLLAAMLFAQQVTLHLSYVNPYAQSKMLPTYLELNLKGTIEGSKLTISSVSVNTGSKALDELVTKRLEEAFSLSKIKVPSRDVINVTLSALRDLLDFKVHVTRVSTSTSGGDYWFLTVRGTVSAFFSEKPATGHVILMDQGGLGFKKEEYWLEVSDGVAKLMIRFTYTSSSSKGYYFVLKQGRMTFILATRLYMISPPKMIDGTIFLSTKSDAFLLVFKGFEGMIPLINTYELKGSDVYALGFKASGTFKVLPMALPALRTFECLTHVISTEPGELEILIPPLQPFKIKLIPFIESTVNIPCNTVIYLIYKDYMIPLNSSMLVNKKLIIYQANPPLRIVELKYKGYLVLGDRKIMCENCDLLTTASMVTIKALGPYGKLRFVTILPLINVVKIPVEKAPPVCYLRVSAPLPGTLKVKSLSGVVKVDVDNKPSAPIYLPCDTVDLVYENKEGVVTAQVKLTDSATLAFCITNGAGRPVYFNLAQATPPLIIRCGLYTLQVDSATGYLVIPSHQGMGITIEDSSGKMASFVFTPSLNNITVNLATPQVVTTGPSAFEVTLNLYGTTNANVTLSTNVGSITVTVKKSSKILIPTNWATLQSVLQVYSKGSLLKVTLPPLNQSSNVVNVILPSNFKGIGWAALVELQTPLGLPTNGVIEMLGYKIPINGSAIIVSPKPLVEVKAGSNTYLVDFTTGHVILKYTQPTKRVEYKLKIHPIPLPFNTSNALFAMTMYLLGGLLAFGVLYTTPTDTIYGQLAFAIASLSAVLWMAYLMYVAWRTFGGG